MCSLLDIPTYSNVVESLHVMFMLYLEFSENPFLNAGAAAAPEGMMT